MKNSIRSSVLLAALTVACPVFGQTPNLTLTQQVPNLPIGNERAVRSWNVTNTFNYTDPSLNLYRTVDISLCYSNSSGLWQPHTLWNSQIYFESYDQFQSILIEKALLLADTVKADIGYTNSTVWFIAGVTYNSYAPTGSGTYLGLNFNTNVPSISGITSDFIKGVAPNVEHVLIPVPSLQQFTIEVQSNAYTGYTNTWTPEKGWTIPQHWPQSYPLELTTTNLLVLNQWICDAELRSRLIVVSSGQTNTYTQHGGLIVPPAPNMVSPHRLDVHMPCGSDVIVERSRDLKNWSGMASAPWSLGTNFISLGIQPICDHEYYRATAR